MKLVSRRRKKGGLSPSQSKPRELVIFLALARVDFARARSLARNLSIRSRSPSPERQSPNYGEEPTTRPFLLFRPLHSFCENTRICDPGSRLQLAKALAMVPIPEQLKLPG